MINKWEKIFDEETLKDVVRLLGDDATEDIDTLKDAIEYLSANVDYDTALDVAKRNWDKYDSYNQILSSLALLGEDGEAHLSRFMIITDYLIGKLGSGE